MDINTGFGKTESRATSRRAIPREQNEDLSFGQFVQSIVAMCLLEKDDILRFCFYIFDSNKNGFIDNDELDTMFDALHNVDKKRATNEDDYEKRKKGDLKTARQKIEKDIDQMAIAGKLEFIEMKLLMDKYPRLFYPAFRIQNKLMSTYFGLR